MPPSPTEPTPSRSRVTGPVFDAVDRALCAQTEYARFRSGELSRAAFATFLDRMADDLVARGVPADDVHFAKRFPPSPEDFVRQALATLVERGLLPCADYDAVRAEEGQRAAASYDHGDYATYIYPEEGMLLLAIADIVQPRRVVFLGSYCGYWACWALPAILGNGGTAVFVDPDPRVQQVARDNLAAGGLLRNIELVVETGQAYLTRTAERFDLVVLDAEGARDDSDPEQRGKRVYRPLLAHALPRMVPDALLVCHNILLSDHSGAPFFARILARNEDELGPFLELVEREIEGFTELRSTEGVGVGRRRSQPGAET